MPVKGQEGVLVMSNSAGVVPRRPMLAMVATVAIVALLAGLLSLGMAGRAMGDETPGPTYPTAQGWSNQPNEVKYHITSDGYAYFWTTEQGNYGMVDWETPALPGLGVSFWYGDDPVRVKFKKCGVSVRVEIYGYDDGQVRTLPAWPCKAVKQVAITKVKKLSATRVRVYGRTSLASQLQSGRLVVRDLTKSTDRRCAWVKPNGRLKYTRRVGGTCKLADAPTVRRLPKAASWSRVVKAPKRHRLQVVALVRYKDSTLKSDAVRVRRR